MDETAVAADDVVAAGIEGLYEAGHAPMVRLAFLLTGSPEVAEELVHEAFVGLHRRWDRVANPDAYLRRMVVNACHGHHRRRGVERRHAPAPPPPVLPPEVDEVWDALGSLPPRRRTALVLRYYADLPIAEIADAMDCRPGTVKSLIHRGLASLKEVLEP